MIIKIKSGSSLALGYVPAVPSSVFATDFRSFASQNSLI